MKRNKLLATLLFLLVTTMLLSLAILQPAAAENAPDPVPSVTIEGFNLSYSDSVYILYAVSGEGFDENKNSIHMLFWNNAETMPETQDGFVKGTEDYEVDADRGTTKMNGKKCRVFYSNGLAAKEMADDIVARAYVEADGEIYYSNVIKFSVLEYVCRRLESGDATQSQRKLYEKLLAYGSAAQENFNYRTDRPADATYYAIDVDGGLLPDGFGHGRFLDNETVTIRHADPAPGTKFSHWENASGVIVGYDDELEVTVSGGNLRFVAVFKDVSQIANQLHLAATEQYGVLLSGIEFPSSVSFEDEDGNAVVLAVSWITDPGTWEDDFIGTRRIYAAFETPEDAEPYGIRGGEDGDVYLDVTTLPYTFSLNAATGEWTVTGYFGTESTVTVPAVFRGAAVTAIAQGAFDSVSSMTALSVPSSVTSIAFDAFHNCTNVAAVTLPFTGDGTGAHGWIGYVFGAVNYSNQTYYVPALASVTFAGGTTKVPDYALYGCAGITELHLPEGIQTIGNSAFYKCAGITSLVLPAGVTQIHDAAFYGCTALGRVDITDLDAYLHITALDSPLRNGAALYCNGVPVTKVTISRDITFLYPNLAGCSTLVSLTIPNTVTGILSSLCENCANLETLVFEDGCKITSFRYGICANCPKLREITIPASVTSVDLFCPGCTFDTIYYDGTLADWCKVTVSSPIMGYARHFALKNEDGEYEFLTRAEIPDGVAAIGAYQFAGCPDLAEVVIPDSVKEIGNYAFSNCPSFSSVTLSPELLTIGDCAFQNCPLFSLTLPSKLANIGSNAFYGCYQLAEICNASSLSVTAGSTGNGYVAYYAEYVFSPGNGASRILRSGNYIFYGDGETLFLLGYAGTETALTLPACPTGYDGYAIHRYAFYENRRITSVIIPDCVTAIGKEAFCLCSALTEIVIPDSVTTIGNFAFSSCTKLATVTIGSGVTAIGDYAFNNCTNLAAVTIGSGVTSIGNEAFYGCTNLLEVYNRSALPIQARNYAYGRVGYHAFNIYTPEAGGPGVYETIGDYLFCTLDGERYLVKYNGSDTALTLPTVDGGYQIGHHAFYEKSNLVSITIPDCVTAIGNSAFSDCSALTEIVIPDSVTAIGDDAFYHCTALTEIVIPDSVISIDNGAFSSCSKLATVTIGSGVTTIGDLAFGNCSALTEIVIPDSVTTIGNGAFMDCSKLATVTIGSGVTTIGDYAFNSCSNLLEVYNRSALPIQARSTAYGFVGYNAFNVYTPEAGSPGVYETIGDYLFCTLDGERYLVKYNGSDTVLTLPTVGGGYQIGHHAFYGKRNLTSITIPDCVTAIGDDAFNGCQNLAAVTIGSGVTSIGNNAFNSCSNLLEVYNRSALPIQAGSIAYGEVGYHAFNVYTPEVGGPGVYETIGDYVFCTLDGERYLVNYNGSDLALTLPTVDGGYQIGYHAFYQKSNLVSITIPDCVTAIGDSAFCWCSALTEIVIPDSVTAIGEHAFKSCSKLAAVTIPDSVTAIGNEAFYGCSKLATVTIGSSVTSIGNYAFYDCSALTEIAIPNSVTTIGDRIFYRCSKLTTVTIGSGVTSIGERAFSDCTLLTDIHYNGTAAKWAEVQKESSWNSSTGNYTIHCQDADLDKNNQPISQ